MVNVGFIYPGQGAQYVGMGKEMYDQFNSARAMFDAASAIVGYDVAALCFSGPEEKLTKTACAQVCIFTVSLAIHAVIAETYPRLVPALNCGLSLGEYSALVSAGILDMKTALSIVQQRGALMEAAGTSHPGSMVSVIGLDEAACRAIAELCDVDMANFNSPEQIVLSGHTDGIVRAHAEAVARGAKKAVILNVSGAFHSRLMEPAAQQMETVLAPITLAAPVTPFIPNVTARYESDVAAIKAYLVKQVSHSVMWTQSMQFGVSQGVLRYMEIGPGKVLKGLARRINKDIQVLSVETPAQIAEIESFIAS